ncbi:hypothetical protein PL373_18980 [Tenacibaculum maritimum]|nr:hypothetical protein [Tenacibaculum maritimum]MDB0603173.1 hypothetical protein [Tenacibaculum maritimum]MDB0610436.1 hypothetical protein [Tenacibaculum maritimum]
MINCQRQQQGVQKNKLLRYKDVLDLYHEKKTEDIPVTVVWRKYIYPKFHISRTTLYTILGTPVVKELKQIHAIEQQQLSMFA